MSEVVTYTGKIRKVEPKENETLEDVCKIILERYGCKTLEGGSWPEMLCDKLYERYVVVDGSVYEVIESHYQDPDDFYCAAHRNPDGTISYDIRYHNGGCCFTEAIEAAINSLE